MVCECHSARLSPLAPECDGFECCDVANLCSIVFSLNQKRIRKSFVCLIRSLRTVTSLSIAAASVLSRQSVSIWFGPPFKICFIISNVLTDLGTLSVGRYEHLSPIADGSFTSPQPFSNYGGGSSRFRQRTKSMLFLWCPRWSGPAGRHFAFALSPSSTERRTSLIMSVITLRLLGPSPLPGIRRR
jgi:hypothetical protein